MFNKFMLPVVLLGSLLLGSLSVFVGRADGQVAVAPEVKPAWLTELSAGLKESYDSSVFLSGVDPRYLPPGYVVPAGSVAALRDRPSWLTTVSPRVGVNLAPLTGVTWLQGLTLGYAPEVVRYQATPSEDYAAQRFTAGLQAKGEGWSAGAEEAFTFIDGSKYGPTYPGNYITAYNIAAVRERREQIQDRLALTGRYDLGRWFVRPTASLLDYDLMTKALSSTVYPGYMNYGSRYDVNGGLDGGYQLTSGLAATLGYRYGHQYQEQFSFMPFRADNDYQRVLAGMPVFMTSARGPGRIAFSRDGAGQVFALHLRPGETVEVREHQFLAATDAVDFTFNRVRGMANMLLGGTGFFIDTFTAAQGEGILWLHGYGNVFEVQLQPGEQIDIEPGGWIYESPSVTMETMFQRLSTGLFASAGQVAWNRFTGPGRIALQSMYIHQPSGE